MIIQLCVNSVLNINININYKWLWNQAHLHLCNTYFVIFVNEYDFEYLGNERIISSTFIIYL